MINDPYGHVFYAAVTLVGGLATAAGIVMVAQGRAREVYPWAAAAAVSGGVVGAVYALGGDEPPRGLVK